MVEKKEEEITIPEEDKMIVPEGFTAEEWSDLSDTEKEGILSKEEDDEKKEDVLTEDQLKAIAEEKEPEKEPEKELEKELSDEDLLSYRVTVDKSKLPSVGEDVIPEELQTELDGLQIKYDDGDIKLAEFIVGRDKINRQIVRHTTAVYEAEKEKALQELTWQAEQTAFFKARPLYDNSPKGKAFYGALNQIIKDLDANPDNVGLSGMALLVKADKMVREMFGVGKKEVKVEKVEKAEAEKREKIEKPPAKVPDKPTLADVPAAKENSAGGWISAIDALHGAAYEAALERLTSDQRERYLAGK